MATCETLTAELTALRESLEGGGWQPSAREHACAALLLAASPDLPSADALVAAVQLCGPDIAMPGAGPLAHALVQCAAVIRYDSLAASPSGLRLRAAIESLLKATRRAPLDVGDGEQLAMDCLADLKLQFQDWRWTPSDADWDAVQISGLTGGRVNPAYTGGVIGGGLTDQEQADLLLKAAPALRHAAALPSTGPIPLLLTAVANLCDALREPVDKAARDGLPLDRVAGPDGLDVIRQIGTTNALFHRLANMLSSLLPR